MPKSLQNYITYIMKMPYQKWWVFRSLRWISYAKSHVKDKHGNLLNENNVPDWFMTSPQTYCDAIETKSVEEQSQEIERNWDTLTRVIDKLEASIELNKIEQRAKALKERLND